MMPTVTRLELGHVVLPDSHPRSAGGDCPILSFVIEHGDGLVVVDTGPRMGHAVIDELYRPQVASITDALHHAGFDERDVTAVVNTHLHFDHCGQNYLLPAAPVWVTQAEVQAAQAEFYTVPEWAAIEPGRLRLGSDGEQIAQGVRLLHTPGHTPGHQSVVIDSSGGLEIVAGQACYTCAEFSAGSPMAADMQDESWLQAGNESLERLRELAAEQVHLSHDRAVWRP